MGKRKTGQASARPRKIRASFVAGQVSTEYLILLGSMMVALLVALVTFWLAPNFAADVQKQHSDSYWATARPFAIATQAMYPNLLLLELKNTEPVTLTITGVSVGGVNLNFSNYSVPFSWASASPRCSGGSCAMIVRPGQTQIIATDNFTTNPTNPCLSGASFMSGWGYAVNLTITYNASSTQTQAGTLPLIGKCSPRS
jgi:hypothetical protein